MTTKHTPVKDLLTSTEVDREVTVKGWVRTKRGNAFVQFIALNDGSTINNIQVVADTTKFSEEELKTVTTGAAIQPTGTLVKSTGAGQTVEIQATQVFVYGVADPDKFPLCNPKNIHLNFCVRSLTYVSVPAHSVQCSRSVMRSRLLSTNFLTTTDFTTSTHPSSPAPMPKAQGEMFRVTLLNAKTSF